MISVSFDRKIHIPALIGAGISILLQRAGFLSLFFLVPLGFIAFRYSYRAAWTALFFAILAYFFITVSIQAARGLPLNQLVWDLVFFAAMSSVFIWIVAPPPSLSFNLPGSLRMVAGSCLGALLFIGVYFRLMATQAFSDQIAGLTAALVSLNRSPGADVVENALMENLNVDLVLDMMRSIMLRGGGLLTCIFIFFASRQISLSLARLTRREKGIPVFMTFKVNPAIIWALSASLLLLVFSRVTGLETPEIILWNVLILCVMLYLAQGLGILQFFMSRPAVSSFLRLLLLVVFFVLLFSPVLNTILFVGIVLLGIAENWVAFRLPKENGPSSTPET